MIISTKNYTKKKKKRDRTLGQMVKAKLYRKNHTKTRTCTHSQKEKKKKEEEESHQINTNLPMIINSNTKLR